MNMKKSLNTYSNGFLGIKSVFGFHHFQPGLNGFFDISDGIFIGFALRKTARQCENLDHVITILVLFDNYMQFH